MTRRLLSVILWSLCLGTHAAAPPGRPGPGAVPPAPDGERFLFIVDMSSSMERLQSAVEATIYDLLSSGLGGHMRVGDTYGLWMFNKQTYVGKFPMQVWDSRRATQLGTIAAAFLNNQPYEKPSNLKQAMGTLCNVVRAVSNLNVFIISDGDSPMHGTPFDKTINDDYKKKSRERNQAKRPFVTTLVVRGGWFVSASVTVAGHPFPLPDRAPSVLAESKKPALTNQEPARISAVRATVPASNAPPSRATPPVDLGSQTIPPVATTSLGPPSNPAIPARDPAATPLPQPSRGRILSLSIVTNSSVAPTPPSAPEQCKTDLVSSATVAQSNVMGTNIALAEPSVPPPPLADRPAAAKFSESVPAPAAESATEKSALAALLPAPIPVAARERGAEVEPAQPEAPPPLQVASVVAQPGLSAGILLGFGIVLLAAAGFLLLVALRRARPTANGSLITQSMDRH